MATKKKHSKPRESICVLLSQFSQDSDCNGDLECVDGIDDSCPGLLSRITVGPVVNSLLYVYVTGFSSRNGTFTLDVT